MLNPSESAEFELLTEQLQDVLSAELESGHRAEFALLAGKAFLEAGRLEQAGRAFGIARRDLVDERLRSDLAAQYVALAAALIGGEAAGVAREECLRAASDLDPRASGHLAQHLEDGNHPHEAIRCLEGGIRRDPHAAGLYLRLGRLLERTGEANRAVMVYLDLAAIDPSPRTYLTVAQRLGKIDFPVADTRKTVKVALLGNATLDHLRAYLLVESFRAGIYPEIYQAGFDRYAQEILDPDSELYRFSPDVVICSIHASRLFPRVHKYPFDLPDDERLAEVEAGMATIGNLLDTLTARTPALVLFHNVVAPRHPALGVQDRRSNLGQGELFAQINSRLAALARERYRSVYIVDEERVQSWYGKATATDQRLWLSARIPWTGDVLGGLSREYLRHILPYLGLSKKCIVLDLDNTLWGGVIGEDGIDGIQIGPDAPGNAFLAFQQELERMWQRGILLTACSKNNEADALHVLEHHPNMVLRPPHFAAVRINWTDKATNIRSMARELNIGLDSLVFLDDNPVERAAVRAELPEVMVIDLPRDPALYRETLLALDVFETLSQTDEDRARNRMYAEQRSRMALEEHFRASGSLDDYLAALDITVTIEALTASTRPRVAQLTGKTNQFNLTTRRYSEAQIEEMASRGAHIYSARVTDRFGDNGIVAVIIALQADERVWDIDTFLLSCRVMGRGVESAVLAFITECAGDGGAERLRGWYLPTPKNEPARDVYHRHGFVSLDRGADGSELWELSLTGGHIGIPRWLKVVGPKNSKLLADESGTRPYEPAEA